MKKVLIIAFLSINASFLSAQFEFGIKAGLSSIDLITNSISVNDGEKNYDIAYADSQYGHHFGLYTRLKVVGIYLEPAAIFNSNSINYHLSEYTEDGVIKTLKNETYNQLDIPIMLGIKAGIIRIFGGPVAHLHINSSSELVDLKGYSQRFKDATYGFQAGFGLDLWKIRLDISYEGNFSKFGDHINIGGHDYSFDESASRLIGTVGYAF